MAASGDDVGPGWRDIATVTVPVRTKRSTIVEKALQQAGIKDGKESLRVLDEQSAREIGVEWEQPPPRLKLG